jgi:hypothetical protein
MTTIATFRESIPATRRGKRAASLTDAQMAAAWLNAVKGAAYRRVLALHAHLDRLDGLLSGELQAHSPNEWFGHQSATNTLLERYSFVPRLARDPSGARRYTAVPRRKTGPTVEVSDGRITLPVGEPTVAATLARLYAARELFHVHRCDRCGRWHARVRRMDRFCSRDCQIEHYTSSDEARERNRLAQERHRESPAIQRS